MRVRVVLVAVIVAAVVAIIYYVARDRAPATATPAPTSAAPVSAAAGSDRAVSPVRHATRLAGTEERERVQHAIDAAHAARAHAAPPAPHLPDPAQVDPQSYAEQSVEALHEVAPFLQACYETGSARDAPRELRGRLQLVGDPDVGTLITVEHLTDAAKQPLDPELASCLKTTLETVELPPLAEGDALAIEYSFLL